MRSSVAAHGFAARHCLRRYEEEPATIPTRAGGQAGADAQADAQADADGEAGADDQANAGAGPAR
jgi:hypothetical protein